MAHRYRTQHHRKHPHRTRHPGTPSARLPCLWHPNVAGMRYSIRGIVDRSNGMYVAGWTGTPGASALT